MNELMIQGRVSKSVNPVLIYLEPVGGSQFLAYVIGQRGYLNHFHRNALLEYIFPEA